MWEHSQFVLNVPVNLFVDDTSTNISKRWLPLHCAQMQLSGLPVVTRNKGVFSQFVAASENVSILSISKCMLDEISYSQINPSKGYDAKLGQEVNISVQLASVIGEFNMLALVCNHNGATAVKFCPKCHALPKTILEFHLIQQEQSKD